MKCIGCRIEKPIGDFNRLSQGRAGFRTRCKPCSLEQDNENRRRRRATPVGRAAKREYERAWHLAHPERKAAADRAYYVANSERVAAINRAWYIANRERSSITMALWREANPEKVARYSHTAIHRRRARLAGVEVTVVVSEFCGVCRGRLRHGEQFPDDLSTTIGHEPPLSRAKKLGVTTVIERPEHWVCNRYKGHRLDSELAVQRLEHR